MVNELVNIYIIDSAKNVPHDQWLIFFLVQNRTDDNDNDDDEKKTCKKIFNFHNN